MANNLDSISGELENEYLWPMLKELPYFRALLRAVEAAFYKEFQLTEPVLDIGCGDGHFAELVFDRALSVGMDPVHASLREASARKSYDHLVQAEGDRQPFPSVHFATAISNSVLEHIPDVEQVLEESGRLLKQGGLLLFCVPNHRWRNKLRIAGLLKKMGLKKMAIGYEDLFVRISRHINMLSPEQWGQKLADSGFALERHWHYFPPKALHALELGHYWGLPSLITRWLSGRWILVPQKWNLAIPFRLLRPLARPEKNEQGTYTWFVAKRK